MEKELSDYLCKKQVVYIKIENPEHFKIVYDLMINGIVIDNPPDDDIVYTYFGLYNRFNKNYDLMKKYYELAINKGNWIAMGNMAYYYSAIENNYEETERYYLLAIEKNPCDGYLLRRLAICYENQKKYLEANKYYLLSIANGNSDAALDLADCYGTILFSSEEVEKYYLMAIEMGNDKALRKLALHYKNIHFYNKMKEYFEKAIEKDDSFAMYELAIYYNDYLRDDHNYKKYLEMAANHGYMIAILKINEILKKNYDFKFAISVHGHLDEENLNKLNDIICYFEQNKERLVHKTVCTVCKNDDLKCVQLKNGHSVCIACSTRGT